MADVGIKNWNLANGCILVISGAPYESFCLKSVSVQHLKQAFCEDERGYFWHQKREIHFVFLWVQDKLRQYSTEGTKMGGAKMGFWRCIHCHFAQNTMQTWGRETLLLTELWFVFWIGNNIFSMHPVFSSQMHIFCLYLICFHWQKQNTYLSKNFSTLKL